MSQAAARGEVWLTDFSPTRGHEQSGTRPALVLSVDAFNHGPAGLVVVVPITSVPKGIRLHVPTTPPDGGLRQRSFVKCEDLRSIAQERLIERRGTISGAALTAVEDRVRLLLGL